MGLKRLVPSEIYPTKRCTQSLYANMYTFPARLGATPYVTVV